MKKGVPCVMAHLFSLINLNSANAFVIRIHLGISACPQF